MEGALLQRLLALALFSHDPAPTRSQSALVSHGTMHLASQPLQKLWHTMTSPQPLEQAEYQLLALRSHVSPAEPCPEEELVVVDDEVPAEQATRSVVSDAARRAL